MTVFDRRFAPSAISWVLLAQVGALSLGTSVAAAEPVKFEVAASDASNALSAFSQQAGLQILFEHKAVEGRRTQAVVGEYEPTAALQLLLKESGLTFEFVNEKTVAIREPAADRQRSLAIDDAAFQKTSAESAARRTVRVAQASAVEEGAAAPGKDQTKNAGKVLELEEVLVTGSHIRGAQNLSSPMITFNRKDIEASGHSTVQQFIQSLPQNLSDVSDMTAQQINSASSVATYNGSGINLRGLGSESTLVLLNGRRLSAAGKGNYVDVSLIPLSAIDRIEVLTDGASAIYGSDAVGGVVNFVMREDFEGAETRARYGAVTEGSHDELQVGQMFGHAWDSGQALVSYEYFRRTPLKGTDRDFIQPSAAGVIDSPAIAGQKRQGALATISHRVSERIHLTTDLFFSQRESAYDAPTNTPDLTVHTESEMQQHGGSLGLTVKLGQGWQARLSGLFDRNDSAEDTRYSDGSHASPLSNDSRLWSIDLGADGRFGSAPGGDVRLALGAQFRNEQFVEGDSGYAAQLERDVGAAYVEVRVPWVSAQNSRPGLRRLDLTLAGRFEDYSDFGSTFNPKLGLALAPVNDLNLRASWGTSFRAPLLSQLNVADNYAFLYPGTGPFVFQDVAGGTAPTMLINGSGAELTPEESTNWTIGFDFAPEAVPEFNSSFTYFDIDYQERIRNPIPTGYDVFGILLDPTYSATVTRHPTTPDVLMLLAGIPSVICAGACPAAHEITAIVDDRLRNLAAVRMSGLDFSMRYALQSSIGDWQFGLAGQYLLRNREQVVRGAEVIDQLNDVWRPVDLRLRNSISFTRGSMNAAAFVNYTDGYRDRRTGPLPGPLQRSTVGSWTTVDLTLQIDLSESTRRWRLPATTLALSATNVFDRNPPFIGSYFGLHFDGVNANPRGRFIALQLTTQWGRQR